MVAPSLERMGRLVFKPSLVAVFISAAALAACAELPDQPATQPLASAVTTTIADGAIAPPPPGFVGFCMRNPALCAPNKDTREVVLNDATRAELIAVNDRINHAITYMSDSEQYGIVNVWTLSAVGGYGNCKDYALAKRQALIADGLPEGALRIAIVRTPWNELHAVLTVDTDRGDFVLDSIAPEIEPWSATQYTWLSRQSTDSPLKWVSLDRKVADAQ